MVSFSYSYLILQLSKRLVKLHTAARMHYLSLELYHTNSICKCVKKSCISRERCYHLLLICFLLKCSESLAVCVSQSFAAEPHNHTGVLTSPKHMTTWTLTKCSYAPVNIITATCNHAPTRRKSSCSSF